MINGYMRATKLIVPAARSIIAKELNEKYEMTEQEIANYLDVAQAAVSKYLKGRYSNEIMKIEAGIDRSAIAGHVSRIAAGRKEYAGMAICTICSMENGFACRFSKAARG
jgi:predicted transcriptional regulator